MAGHGPLGGERPTASARTWPARVGLIVWSVLVAVVLFAGAELLARSRMPDYLASTRGLHVFSPTFGWVNRSDVSVLKDGKRISLNTHGHRGRALAVPRRPGLTRVIVLGDSIAFGLGVADDETFTSLLDGRDNGIEAANLAVPGYGPDQELLVLQQEGLRYEPDVVVLAFCLANDFAEGVLPVSLYDGRMPKPRFLLVRGGLVLDRSSVERSGLQPFLQWISDDSVLFNLALAHRRADAPAPGQQWHERYAQAIQDEEHALQLSLAVVGEIHKVCRERGIRLLVAAFPDRTSFRARTSLAARFLRSLADEGIDAIDMATHFREVGPRLSAVALDGTGHLNAVGHRVAFEALEREIGARPSSDARAALPDSPDS